MTSTDYQQSHFVIYELVIPYCTVCTPINDSTKGWNTPLTCQESSDAEYSLFFTEQTTSLDIPEQQSLPFKSKLNGKIFRQVVNQSETTPQLKPFEGLASRGTMSITMEDFPGDPGPLEFNDKGTFFGKLLARNILNGKKIISHYYTASKANPAGVEVETHVHFVTDAQLNGTKFVLKGKDALKDVEDLTEQFPAPVDCVLTTNINSSQTSFDVNDGTLIGYPATTEIRIDSELMTVTNVVSNTVTVATRGSGVAGLYKTSVDSHDLDANVQPCYTANNKLVEDVLEDIYLLSGIDPVFIDKAQWTAELQEWNSDARLFTVFSKPDTPVDVLNQILQAYVIDMWFDQASQKILLSATSAWKRPRKTIKEGSDFVKPKISSLINDRFSRAYVYNQKSFQAENDDEINFSNLTVFTDAQSETSDFYGDVKLKEFDNNPFIQPTDAFSLVSRYVRRTSRVPKEITVLMEERQVAGIKYSDILEVITRETQNADGDAILGFIPAQVIKIQPKFGGIGRQYDVKLLSYVPELQSGVYVITGNVFDLNLFNYINDPNIAVDVTFVFDGCTIGSTASNIPSVRAGNFAPGSTIKIICTNNTVWSAKGGDGVSATASVNESSGGVLFAGSPNGANSYQSDGVNTEIYINYGVVDGYNTKSEMLASGGGGASAGAYGWGREAIGSYAITASAASGGGGSGIGVGGSIDSISAAKIGSGWPYYSDEKANNGSDGTLLSGGAGAEVSAYARYPVGFDFAYSSTSASGGRGGDSGQGGGAGAYSSLSYSPSSNPTLEGGLVSSAGLAGGSIKGTNVTVYNLAADSSKFIAGNSDAFTLITV